MSRSLIYLYGLDPRGARYYLGLFRTSVEKVYGTRGTAAPRPLAEFPRSAEIVFEIGPKTGPFRTRLFIPDWHRLVYRALIQGYAGLAVAALLTFVRWVWTGTAWRHFRFNWRMGTTFLILFLPSCLVLAATAIVLASVRPPLPWLIGSAAICFGALALYWRWYLDHTYTRYLSWSFCYITDFGDERPRFKSIKAEYYRYDDQVTALALRLYRDGEEVVLVGHSMGSIQAIQVARRLEEALRAEPSNPAHGSIRLITLAGTWAFAATMPTEPSREFAREIQQVIKGSSIPWLDIAAWEDPFTCPGSRALMPKIAGFTVNDADQFDYADPKLPSQWEPAFYAKNVRNLAEVHFSYIVPPRVENGCNFYRLFNGRDIIAADYERG